MHLRKAVRLNEIDKIIEEVQEHSLELAEEALRLAEKMAEEERQQNIKNTIKRLCRRKIEFKHREVRKRKNSFKGRDREPLLETKDEREEFKERLENPDPPRPKSPVLDREDRMRPLQYEHQIDFQPGRRKKTGDGGEEEGADDGESSGKESFGDHTMHGGMMGMPP